jgi:H+/Cl- antiporter ClcA
MQPADPYDHLEHAATREGGGAVPGRLHRRRTNLAFFGRWSHESVSPAAHRLGGLVVVVPVLGGIAVGLLARYRSTAIRGHGIPEAMEQDS